MYLAMTGKKPGEASAVKVEPSADKVEASATKVEASAVKVKEEAMTPVKLESDQLKAELCQAKGGLCQVKQELAEKSDLELSCLTSPARILDLYKINFSPADIPRKKCKVDLHVWIYMYICIYVFFMC